MIGIGIVGYGYWGPNLVRNFSESSETQVIAVADLRPERLGIVERRYPGIDTGSDYQALLDNPKIDAIVIATPVSTHHELALRALRAGKHVLVEKPLTTNSETALELIEEAERRRLILMVDHTFVYTPAVRKIKQLVAAGDLGQIYYYDSVRVNLGIFQHDVNVLWDLAVHDLSIMDYALDARPSGVSATGISHIPGRTENIAFMSLLFDGSIIAHIHVNWLAPVKVRRTLVGGSRKMIVYDDLEPSEKIKVYDRGIDVNNNPESVYRMLVSYRSGDMYAPRLDLTEALQVEVAEFARAVTTGAAPVTDGRAGLRIVQLLEAATESMHKNGQMVALPGERVAHT